MSDNINYPSHYTFGKIEVIDYIRDKLSPEQFQGHCMGNILKYVSRWEHKGGLEDLKKAQVYLGWMIESVEMQKQQKKDTEFDADPKNKPKWTNRQTNEIEEVKYIPYSGVGDLFDRFFDFGKREKEDAGSLFDGFFDFGKGGKKDAGSSDKDSGN